MEDIEVLKKGMVVLIYPQEARLDQFDHNLWKCISESCKFSLPIQWKSTHIVHPNRFFSIVHPLFMSALPQSVQDRVMVHSGTKMKVLANLLRHSLPWDRIPSDIGGCVDLDLGVWLSERMIKEEKINGTSLEQSMGGSEIGNLLSRLREQAERGQGAEASGLEMQGSLQPDQTTSKVLAAAPFGSTSSSQLLLGSAPTPMNTEVQVAVAATPSAAANSKKNAKKKEKTVAKAKSSMTTKSGRKSDPRMDRAVEAKLADPSLSLIDALRAGGFDIPDSNGVSPQYVVVDGDNVKITQRKNQLLRRLRTAKADK